MKALIVGGGLGGMVAAIALSESGVACTIVEKSADWKPVGIGIALRNSPLRALATLGLLDACAAAGRAHDAIHFCDASGRVFSSARTHPLVVGPAMVTMPRAVLHGIFAQRLRELAVEVRLGTVVTALVQGGEGVDVTLSSGGTGRFDVVIGADGLHSQIRTEQFAHSPEPTLTGQLSWRAGAALPPSVDAYYILRNGVRSVGLVPIGEDRIYLWMLEPLPRERIAPERWLDELRLRLADFGPMVADTVAAFNGQVDCRPLQTLLVPPPWNAGRVLLLGDSAHTTTPHLAYGVGIAIEDAVVLAGLIAGGGTIEQVAVDYAARRFERARLVVETSAQLGRWEVDPPADRTLPVRVTHEVISALEEAY